MFRKLYNQAVLTGFLIPKGPVLIVKGGAALDPTTPDMAFVRTMRNGVPTVYLPGASIKGVLRAHVERLLATFIDPAAAEDPFVFQSPRRRQAREQRRSTPAVFRLSCEADRLFGSTEISGRFRIGDAHPTPETLAAANQTEIRYNVAIDRSRQSARNGGLFDQEAVTSGRFAFQATLENFELWMLSLVLQATRDLHQGLIQIGHSKSRGFGSMGIEDPSLVLRWPGHAPSRLQGVGACESSESVRKSYGLESADSAPLPPERTAIEEGLFQGYRFDGWTPVLSVFSELSGAPWQQFVERAQRGLHGA
jgi:CRISPR-associated RAMP protein (TIGR02581 family)